jgi:PHD/YefM family antitoxin component YafN of YafNO toxin-antitoxin module
MTELTIKANKAVVLLPIDEYERMRETIEILSNPETIRNIKRGRREYTEGKTIELEEFWRKEIDAK